MELGGCESLPEDCQSPAWPVYGVPAATSMRPQFPQCSACRGTSPLSIKLMLRGNPLILLEENKASVKLSVLIQLFSNHLDGSILNFLLLKAVSVDGVLSRGAACSQLGEWWLG